MDEEKIEEVEKPEDDLLNYEAEIGVEESLNLHTDSEKNNVVPKEKVPVKNVCCRCSNDGNVRDGVRQQEGKAACSLCKTADNAVIDRCSKREKSSGGRRRNKKTVTDEGDQFVEEEIIDNFAIISFKSLHDLQNFEAEEEASKQRELEEKRKLEQKLLKPVPTKKHRDVTNKSKENDSAGALQADGVEDNRSKTDSAEERMAVKRLLEDNDREVIVATKLPKTEVFEEPDAFRQSQSVPERSVSRSSNGVGSKSPRLVKMDAAAVSGNSSQENVEKPEKSSSVTEGISSTKTSAGNMLSGLLAAVSQTSNCVLNQSSLPAAQFPLLSGFPPISGLPFPPGFPLMPSNLVSQLSVSTSSSRNSEPVQAGTSSSEPAPSTPKQPTSSIRQKRSGKWCAMHVRIAWDIYKQEQQKKRVQETKESSTTGVNSTASYSSARVNSVVSSKRDKKSFSSLQHSGCPPSDADKDKPLPLLTDSAAERHKISGRVKEVDRSCSSGALLNGAPKPVSSDCSAGKSELFGAQSTASSRQSANNSTFHSAAALSSEQSAAEPIRDSARLSVSVSEVHSRPSTSGGTQARKPSVAPTPAGSLPPLPVPNFSQAAMDALIRPQGASAAGLAGLAPFGFMKDLRLPGANGSLVGAGLMDPYAVARQRQLEALNSSILERERTEEFLRFQAQQQQQQAMLQRTLAGSVEGAGALSGLLERELMERRRLLMAEGPPQAPLNQLAPTFANFSGASASGILPPVTPGLDFLARNSALPPGFPNPISLAANPLAAGGLAPFATPFALGKLPMPFSNTLEQLARQKRDNEHVLNR